MLIHCLLIWPYSRSKELNSNQKAHPPGPWCAGSLCNIHEMISSLMIAVWVHLYFDLWVEKILLEEEIAIHSSILAWKIPCTEGPGRLQSMRSQRAGQNWAWALTNRGYFENKGPPDSISKNYILQNMFWWLFQMIIHLSMLLYFCFVFFFSCSVISNSLCPHSL